MVAEPLREAPDLLPAGPGPDEDDSAVLDAYSAAVSAVAESLIPSVASLRVTRQMGSWSGGGAGSGVAFTPDGYIATSAHVVAGTDRGTAAFTDGTRLIPSGIRSFTRSRALPSTAGSRWPTSRARCST